MWSIRKRRYFLVTYLVERYDGTAHTGNQTCTGYRFMSKKALERNAGAEKGFTILNIFEFKNKADHDSFLSAKL